MRTYFTTLLVVILLGCVSSNVVAQKTKFSHADSLRGGLNVYRTCYDVKYYHLEVQPDHERKRIAGSTLFVFEATENLKTLQFDLYPNLKIGKLLYHGQDIKVARDAGAAFVTFPREIQKGAIDSFRVYFGGEPMVAVRPPWDGGFVWKKDSIWHKPWFSVACEGEGASMWWACKDHLSDEPDSMDISVIIPKELVAVANGKLKNIQLYSGDLYRYNWHVSYPINSYNVNISVGNYAHIEKKYNNASGTHNLDYYVLQGNETVAKKHFEQVEPMLNCFEKYFGEYPFWKDGYKLVETPFWGMEHQSAIAYGNHYRNNEYGFDFILVHESGHEWFGNSLSMNDRCDMWLHETFTTYAEAVYVEHFQGKAKAQEYLNKERRRIENKSVMIGLPDVNYDAWLDADVYFKGTWMLHSLRYAVNNDALWWATLKKYAETFRYKNLTTADAISFFNDELKEDYSWLFNQYLRNTELPILEYKWQVSKQNKKQVLGKWYYRWNTKERRFALPVEVEILGKKQRIMPTTEWEVLEFEKIEGVEPKAKINMDLGLFITQESKAEISEDDVVSETLVEDLPPVKEKGKKKKKKKTIEDE